MIRLRDLLMERLKYGITIVKRIATALGETVTEELGKGVNGIAYATESGRIFKITADSAEVALATRLRTKRLYKHIVNVYDVRKLPESYNKESEQYCQVGIRERRTSPKSSSSKKSSKSKTQKK